MAIYLAARLLAGPGDRVAFESLSYPPARAAFSATGASIASIGHRLARGRRGLTRMVSSSSAKPTPA